MAVLVKYIISYWRGNFEADLSGLSPTFPKGKELYIKLELTNSL